MCIFSLQVRLTDALVSGLNFSRGKGDSEVAWIDAMITARDQVCRDAIADTEPEDAIMNESDKILTLEPLPLNEVRYADLQMRNIYIYM